MLYGLEKKINQSESIRSILTLFRKKFVKVEVQFFKNENKVIFLTYLAKWDI